MKALRISLALLLVGTLSLNLQPAIATSRYFIPPRPTSSNPITFSNITSRVDDIPRAVFDSLQETKARNASLAGARIAVKIIRGSHVKGTYYDNTERWINSEVTALAHFAHFNKVYVFEYGFQDEKSMQSKMNSLLNNSSIKADRIYEGKSCVQANRQDAPMVSNITNGWDAPLKASKPMEKEIPYVLAGYCGESDYEKWAEISGTTHELSHQYQIAQFWDNKTNTWPNSAKHEPCWTVEGQAVALGGYSFETNYEQYLADLQRLPRPYYLNSAMTSGPEIAPLYWSPSDVQKYLKDASTKLPGCSYSNRFALSYSLGAYAVMALSAIGGWESTLSLYPMLNSGMTLNSAFKRVYGITWDQALPTISQVVSEMIMKQLDPPGYGTYQATDQTHVVSLIGEQGCATYNASDPQTVRARIQVLQDGHWLDVPTIEQTWAKNSVCRGLPVARSWVTTLKVAMDHGASYRFLYLGEVNIGNRDEAGRGYSQTYVLP